MLIPHRWINCPTSAVFLARFAQRSIHVTSGHNNPSVTFRPGQVMCSHLGV